MTEGLLFYCRVSNIVRVTFWKKWYLFHADFPKQELKSIGHINILNDLFMEEKRTRILNCFNKYLGHVFSETKHIYWQLSTIICNWLIPS